MKPNEWKKKLMRNTILQKKWYDIIILSQVDRHGWWADTDVLNSLLSLAHIVNKYSVDVGYVRQTNNRSE